MSRSTIKITAIGALVAIGATVAGTSIAHAAPEDAIVAQQQAEVSEAKLKEIVQHYTGAEVASKGNISVGSMTGTEAADKLREQSNRLALRCTIGMPIPGADGLLLHELCDKLRDALLEAADRVEHRESVTKKEMTAEVARALGLKKPSGKSGKIIQMLMKSIMERIWS